MDLVYTQSGTLYDKIPDAPRPAFSIPPPPKSNSDSHAGDGVIGTANTNPKRTNQKKARKDSNQNAHEEVLASEVNSVSTDKGKETNQPGSKKNQNKGKKKKQGESLLEKFLQALLEIGNHLMGVRYVMRITGRENVHTKLI